MKKCPQCNSVYSFDTNFCLNDGATLVEENFQMPTQVFATEEETLVNKKPVFAPPPPIPQTEPQRTSGFGKSFLFLIIGLILGGIIVLGILFAVISQMNKKTDVTNSNNANTPTVLNAKHAEPNKTRKDSEFNGFVLKENVNLRSDPNSESMEILPQNDRLEILERDGYWYRVQCEHGSKGWMHGNTIRFNDDAEKF